MAHGVNRRADFYARPKVQGEVAASSPTGRLQRTFMHGTFAPPFADPSFG